MSHESPTQVNRDGNLFNLGMMPASDDTEIQKLDTSAVGLNRTVLDLTGTPSHIHGNEQRDMEEFGNTGGITGNTYSTYKEKVAGGAVIDQTDKDTKIISKELKPITLLTIRALEVRRVKTHFSTLMM